MISRVSDSQNAYAYQSLLSGRTQNSLFGGLSSNTLTKMLSETESGADTVEFSGLSQLLASQPLILPTSKSVQALSSDLASKLGDFFQKNGIDSKPPITIKVNDNTGVVSVTGKRDDTDQIAELINKDNDLRTQIHTLSAISSHAYEIPKHLAFQEEYRNSDSPEDVVAKYSSLFNTKTTHAFSMVYDGSAIQMMVDGKAWGDPVS